MPNPSRTPSLFGDPAFTVRTPKRPGGHAAQLRAAEGHWELGTFPTADEARRAVRAFAGTDPAEPARATPPAELPGDWHWDRCARVRTPKRPGGYAAQLWGGSGYWHLGTFPTIREAHAAGVAFAAGGPAEPARGTPRPALPANWRRCRRYGREPGERYEYVREVKGGAFQARPWLGNGRGNLNLGLCTLADNDNDRGVAEWAAFQLSKAFYREWKPGRTVAEVVALLKRSPNLKERVPEHVEVPPAAAGLLPPVAAPRRPPADDLRRERRRQRRLAAMRRHARGYGESLFGPWRAVFGDGVPLAA